MFAQMLLYRRKSRSTMSKDRKDIYLGEGLRRALAGRKGSLTTNVNLIADRYAGIMREHAPSLSDPEKRILREALAEFRRPIEANEIHGIAGMLQAAITRLAQDGGHDGVSVALLCAKLSSMSYVRLIALIDYLERQS